MNRPIAVAGSPVGLAIVLSMLPAANAQTAPWIAFQDPISGSSCSTVHAANAQFVVLSDTGELVSVGGSDSTLPDAMMDSQGGVLFQDNSRGFIDFATDGDGNPRVFWLNTLGTTVMKVDTVTGRPSDSGKAPSDFKNARCDACPLWDDNSICGPTTPPDNPNPPPVTTNINVCGTDVPVTVGMIAMLLLPLRCSGARRGSRPIAAKALRP